MACQAFYALVRYFTPKGDYLTSNGPLFCALGPLFCALVREEVISAVCKRCANEGFAYMSKENVIVSKC